MTSPTLLSLSRALTSLSLTPTALGSALAGSPGATRAERQSRYRAGARLLAGEAAPDLERLGNLARGLGLEIAITPEGQVRLAPASRVVRAGCGDDPDPKRLQGLR